MTQRFSCSWLWAWPLWGLALWGLAACSSVPDAVNPVEWYKGASDWVSGKDEPKKKAEPAKSSDAKTAATEKDATEKKEPRREISSRDVAKGLSGDQAHARYSEEPAKRDTGANAPRVTSPAPKAEPAKAQAPAAPAKTPAAPVATTQPQQPAPAPKAAETKPTATKTAPALPGETVEQAFQRRLAESGVMTPPQTATAPPPAPELKAQSAASPSAPPLPGMARAASAQPLAQPAAQPIAPAPKASAVPASGLVASVFFADGSAKVSAENRQLLAGVVNSWRTQGGSIRVVGHASGGSGRDPVKEMVANLRVASERADAVGRELVRLGVPVQAVRASAAPQAAYAPTDAEARRAEIYLDRY